MKRFFISLAVLFCLSLLGWGGYYSWQGTSRYSLYQMGKAVKNRDSETLFLYLDIDQIVDGLADSTFKEVEKKTSPDVSSKKNKSPSINTKDLVKNLMPQVIKALKPILKRQITKVVEDIGKKSKGSPLTFCVLSKIKRSGEFAEVFIKTEENQTYAFTMARTSNRVWKIVRIDMDLLELLQKSR